MVQHGSTTVGFMFYMFIMGFDPHFLSFWWLNVVETADQLFGCASDNFCVLVLQFQERSLTAAGQATKDGL